MIHEETVKLVPGDSFTLKARVKPSMSVANACIGIYDGVGTTWSEPVTISHWAKMAVTHNLDANATELTMKFKGEGVETETFTLDGFHLTVTDRRWRAIVRKFLRRLFRKSK